MEKQNYFDVIEQDHDESIKKIKQTFNKKVPNKANYEIKNESLQMANLITRAILENENVIFAAYKKTHPMEKSIIITIQTKNDEYSPKTAFMDSLKKIHNDGTLLLKEFQKEILDGMDID